MKTDENCDRSGPQRSEIKEYTERIPSGERAEVTDAGVYTEEPVDYPDIAWKVAEAVAAGTYDRGILICGTGIGMSIVANKVPGIRAAQCTDPYSAERAIKSNDAQIITFGALVTGEAVAKKLVDIWLDSEFDPSCPSGRKVEKIKELDEKWRCETAGA